MADAGVLRAGDRLPWLEPYRPPSRRPSNRSAGLAAVVGIAGLAAIATLLAVRIVPLPETPDEPTAQVALPPLGPGQVAEKVDWGSVKAVGNDLFGPGIFPFEAISILLLVGVVGAIAIARPLKDDGSSEGEAA